MSQLDHGLLQAKLPPHPVRGRDIRTDEEQAGGRKGVLQLAQLLKTLLARPASA